MAVSRQIAALGFLGIAGFALILWFPYSALQDLPEWIYQGYLFNELVTGHAVDTYFIKTYPVPYTVSQFLISGLLLVFNPMLVSKLLVAFYFMLALWVARRLIRCRHLEPGLAWPVLVSIFVLNGPFWSGYMGYQFGLVVFGFYLSLNVKAQTDVRALVALSVLTFFSHGMIFFAFGLAAAVVSWRASRLRYFVPAMVPSGLLAGWYMLDNIQSKVAGPPVVVNNIISFFAYKLYTLLKLGPYHNFIVFGTDDGRRLAPIIVKVGTLANIGFMGAFLALLGLAVHRSWSSRGVAPELLFGLVMICIASILTPTALGVGNPAERLLYPAFMALSIVAFASGGADPRGRATAAATICMTVALVTGFVLSSVGLVAAGSVYDRVSRGAHPANLDGILIGGQRTLFGHRMVQFDEWMKKTDDAWRTSQVLVLPLVFDTALLGQPGGARAP